MGLNSAGVQELTGPEDNSHGVLGIIRDLREQMASAASDTLMRETVAQPTHDFTSSAGVLPVTIVLSTAAATPVQINGGGHGLVYLKEGSNPLGAVDVYFDGGRVERMRPGDFLQGYFKSARIVTSSVSVTTGNARLAVLASPDVDYREPVERSPLLERNTYSATYNVTSNVPSAATDGVSLEGVKGLKYFIKANGASTISAGTAVYWAYEPGLPGWGETTISYTLPTGRNLIALPDEIFTVGHGRHFLEVRSATNSGGSGAFTVIALAQRY